MESFMKLGIFLIIVICILRIVDMLFSIMIRKKNNINLRFLKGVLNTVIVIVMLFVGMQQFEQTKDIGHTLMQSGSLIVAILTFAAQKTLGNVISGFSVAISKPFDVGQKVRVVNDGNVVAEGIISDITIRHTVVKQFDGQSCIVPNSIMDSSVIVNTNYTDNVGNYFEIEISYDSDVKLACKILHTVAINEPLSLNTKENKVLVKDLSKDGVVLKTTIWADSVDSNFQACSNIRMKVLNEFKKNGIKIPYKTVTIDK